jgi:hypothetical protein
MRKGHSMTSQEIQAIIHIARRAPLQHMAEAEAVSQLLDKLQSHFAPKPAPEPAPATGEPATPDEPAQ